MTKYKNITEELLVTFFYVGKIKYAPGTFGSMGGLLILFLPEYLIWQAAVILLVLLFGISINPIKRYEILKGNDHSSIVIDEVIGMMIPFANPFIIISPFWVISAFILFRIFDILKPYPINKLNEKKGAIFVLLDDVLAGVFTMVILQLLQLGYRISPFFLTFFEII
ncbi:MAG: phosphatidylglycerophosphatase A [Candidatus Kapabacteria bacterium]|nr:phosphatidylglycerophosphatase A [Ignavibacteriota bacterium]MCW5884474.1 phosphatidylglycerophosphatase A [Candidatus Kapabacteria bacterium]